MQRELRGITRKELCQQTQIPLRSLERLETGAFDGLDDGFVRGFVRTVADALGLDLDDTLARMSPEPTSPTDSAGKWCRGKTMRLPWCCAETRSAPWPRRAGDRASARPRPWSGRSRKVMKMKRPTLRSSREVPRSRRD
jgi:hypothetical protein